MSHPRAEALVARIERAFEGVELGDGVSLHETAVIDDYGTLEERRAAREPDEKLDWRKLIDDPDLPRYFGLGYSGLCYLDAPGVRFHLPACMIRVLRDMSSAEVPFDLDFSLLCLLSETKDGEHNRLSILDEPQRRCVFDFLLYVRESLGYEDPTLEQAIACFRSQVADETG
ncbi:MAG: DUF6714 family protein [Isosphaeraceae bacterium]